MFSLLKSITDLAVDVTKIVIAPVEIVVDVVSVPVALIAEAATDLVNDVKNLK